MEQDKIMEHVDEQLQKLYDPLRKDIDVLKDDIKVLNQGAALRETKLAVQETNYANVLKLLQEVREAQNRTQWFTITTMIGVAVVLILRII